MSGMVWDQNCGGGPEIEVPDVYGALLGLRKWRMDEDGWLVGITFPERWTPGENEARCLSLTYEEPDDERPTRFIFLHTHLPGKRGKPYYLDDDGRFQPAEGYVVGEGCPGVARGNHGCGYYARHGARREIGYPGDLEGLVEMYGQVELGPTGLRSSKARIIALVEPHEPYHVRKAGQVLEQVREEVQTIQARWPWWRRALVWRLTHEDVKAMQQDIAKLAVLLTEARSARQEIAAWEQECQRFREEVAPRYGVPIYATTAEMLEHYDFADLTYLCQEDEPQRPDDS